MATSTQRALPVFEAAHLLSWCTPAGFSGLYQGRRQSVGRCDAKPCCSPVDGEQIASIGQPDATEIAETVAAAQLAFLQWREIPAPRRGELVRRIGDLARARKTALADLITLEVGKIRQEALGEVQELIDICDFAVGLSRQLYGLTISSERPQHRLQEQWHPLGPVVVITAFNFPMAVWAWNAMLALVCGDTLLWKPSPQTPLCAIACHALVVEAAASMSDVPDNLSAVIPGDAAAGAQLAADARIALVSATGSCRMGRALAQTVAARLGRYLLELGGNNAMIICPSANLDLALRAILFAAVGTTGQRCTSLRRLIVHESILEPLADSLCRAYRSLRIGDPFESDTHIGPLIDAAAGRHFEKALLRAQAD
ncbi:MAG TPA: aldehyde dehydrogenase family protein, partial [Spongiibacteraceae bacterium]|nr:aldehyde dehydrogenase family protein [Spongiibacteraceae bacterium]